MNQGTCSVCGNLAGVFEHDRAIAQKTNQNGEWRCTEHPMYPTGMAQPGGVDTSGPPSANSGLYRLAPRQIRRSKMKKRKKLF